MLTFSQTFFVLTVFTSSYFCDDLSICFDNISNSSTATTALILARGGSKGIKLKNIQKIDGITLLGISLTALQDSQRFDTIWVSTDNEEIANEALRCELNLNFKKF